MKNAIPLTALAVVLGLVAALSAQQPAASPTKKPKAKSGQMVMGGQVKSAATLDTTAAPSKSPTAAPRRANAQVIGTIAVDPGGGTGGGGPDPGGGTGTGTGGTGSGGTGTGGSNTGGGTGGSSGGTGSGSGQVGDVLGTILAQNPGDTTQGYPPTDSTSTQNAWTGPATTTTTDPSLADLQAGVGSVSGSTGTGTPTGTGTGVNESLTCYICGAPVHTQLIQDQGQGDSIISLYISYQIWHVHHHSDNFWNGYTHDSYTATWQLLGDLYGNPVPGVTSTGLPLQPTAYLNMTGLFQWSPVMVPAGTVVPESEGPPSPAAPAGPTVCPICGGNDHVFSVVLIESHKVKADVHVARTSDVQRWALICDNGHDQSLPKP